MAKIARTLCLLLFVVSLALGQSSKDDPSSPVVTPPSRALEHDAPTSAPAAQPADGIPTNWPAPIWTRRPTQRPPLPDVLRNAFIIPIREPISDKLAHAVQRKILRARGKGAEILIFDMDTPGGSMMAMDEISEAIRQDAADIHTVAFINNQAFSAGAIISLACDEIIYAPTGVLGDAMPIMVGPGGLQEIPEKERGKLESAARALVRVSAKRQDYNVLLCEAMITLDMELWLIENPRTGEQKIVQRDEWAGKVAEVPAGKQDGPASQPADAEWRYVQTIDSEKELVTMDAEEAYWLGFTRHVLPDLDAVESHYNIQTEPVVLSDNWSERLVEFLSSPLVTGLLGMLLLLFFYIEMHTPGFGVFGAIAILCFAILAGSRFLIGMAQWWEIAALVGGAILLVLELFVIPGFGIAGGGGILLILLGLGAMLIPNAPTELPWPDGAAAWAFLTNSALALMLGFLGFLVIAGLLSRILPEMKILQKSRIILSTPPVEPSDPQSELSPMRRVQVGDLGIAETVLRPAGEVRFGQDLLDAISHTGIIDPGSRVRVTEHNGNRLVVEKEDA